MVQHPNSYFMDVKCPGCYRITTVFSHDQTMVVCARCSTVLCQPTGGRARLTEGCSFRISSSDLLGVNRVTDRNRKKRAETCQDSPFYGTLRKIGRVKAMKFEHPPTGGDGCGEREERQEEPYRNSSSANLFPALIEHFPPVGDYFD